MAKKKSRKKSPGRKKKAKSPIRDAIRAEVKRRKMTGYQMVEALAGKVSRTAVYRFLADGGTTDVATAEAFLDVLGIRFVGPK